MNENLFNHELEKQMIGQMLVDQAIPSHELTIADFNNLHYKACWSAGLDLEQQGKQIEPFAIAEIVKPVYPTLTPREIAQYGHGLIMKHDMSDWVRQIKGLAVKRQLKAMHLRAAELITVDADVDVLLSNAETIVSDLRSDNGASNGSGFVSLFDVMNYQVRPGLLEMLKGESSTKLQTGFPNLDEAIGGGLPLPGITIVAALTSAGKSAFVLQMAKQMATRGIPAAYVSAEMSNIENGYRLVSQSARVVNLNSVMRINQTFYDAVQPYIDHMQDDPLWMSDKISDVQTLSAYLRPYVRDKGVKVVVVDYVQLFKLEKHDKLKRIERIQNGSQELKRLSTELGISIVLVAQFNREGAKSGKPSLHDLEGSSQLEKDASVVLIIDRDETDKNFVTMRIEKGRNSGVAEITGNFEGHTLNFRF